MRRVLVLTVLFAWWSSVVLGQDALPSTDQREFTSPVLLLDDAGSLDSWGWAKRAIFEYNRSAIPSSRHARIKEWEHYTIMSPEFTVGVTVVQLGPLFIGSAELIDYKMQTSKSSMSMRVGAMDKSKLPSDPYGKTRFAQGNDFVSFEFADRQRRIGFDFGKSTFSVPMQGSFVLADDPQNDSIAITRPFADEGHFFYENKIFGMPASGSITVEGQTYALPEGESWAIFDWGRGIWPKESQWFWGQAAGRVGTHQVALNLGHGYGDDTRGTCNAILVDGRLHKLDIVDAEFNRDDRLKPWKFTSNDERLTLDFRPIYQQHSTQELPIGRAELFKIHGYYSGKLVLDDGTQLEVKDLLGFAEHMQQRW